MKRNSNNELVLHATWLATTACCTALHDIGFDAEEIAEVLPDAMKRASESVIEICYPVFPGPCLGILPGDAIRIGYDYAERLAAKRAGGVA